MIDKSKICTSTREFTEARVVTFLNPYSFLKIAEANVDLEKFDKICIDGVALKLFLTLVYKGYTIERLSFDFTSVANTVFERAATASERGFVLGSDQTSNDKFITKIIDMFPGIRLDGRSGYFDTDKELSSHTEFLGASDYDFIVVGMGAVKQEETVIAIVNSGFSGRIYTCGGFIHQTAMGDGQYYPSWIDKFNLRFAYRMFKEPSTIRRYLIDYPKAFILLTSNIGKFRY